MGIPKSFSVLGGVVFCLLVSFAVLVNDTHANDAPSISWESHYPSSTTKAKFSPWLTMHPNSYTTNSLESQCRSSVGVKSWVTHSVCDTLLARHEYGEYEVVWVNGIKFDIMRGRVGGTPQGEAKAWTNQHMQTKKKHRALLFDIGDGIYAYWFTGEEGISCNNVGFVYMKPVVVPPEPKPAQVQLVCRKIPFGDVVGGDSFHYHDGVIARNCGVIHPIVDDHFFHMESNLQSNGYTEECTPIIR